ncbi:MAG: PD-(D/E)XK nuclease family protein [Acidimicrobiales bacterium]|nr:PD-(D/E)XK nuclease family protein [Acidimicrobiales bacterium]
MITDVQEVAYGRPATEALAAAVAAAKEGRPLHPVTVVVGSNFVGLSARRALVRPELGLRGLANVQFVTPFRLAELLGADQLLGTRPLTKPVLGAAVRRTLATEPGPFASVAEHEATEAAVAALYGELSTCSPQARRGVGAHGANAAAMVRVCDAVAARLDGFHDEAAVALAAGERPLLGLALEPFGTFIWYLPAPVHAPLADLLSIVFGVAPTVVIAGHSGDPEADGAVFAVRQRVGATVRDAAWVRRHRKPTAARIVSAADADDEVRAVVRAILGLAAEGVALDRVGVFYPAPAPYLALLEQHLAAAGVPANGPSRLRLADSAAGRTLLGALTLPAEQWRRDRVLALVGSAPVRDGREPTRPVAWERLSRQAGVVGGLADWDRKLAAHARALRAELERRAARELPGRDRLEGELADITALGHFVAGLAERVEAVCAAPSWVAKSDAARRLLGHLSGTEAQHARWPELEQRAVSRVVDALSRLASLDELEPEPSHAVFLRALRTELDVTGGRNGRFGAGVLYGPLAAAVGLDLDAVFVVGCAEGLCPAPRRDDALLGDSARLAAHGELPCLQDRLNDQHRALLAALASAPPARRTLSFPRGDLRGGRSSLPSRWLLESASALAGEPVAATEFGRYGPPVVDVVHSYAAGVLAAEHVAGTVERDLLALARDVDRGVRAADHPLAALVGAGFESQAARRSAAFTAWDGNLAGEAIPATSAQPLSASRLEQWAACGFRYFLANLLGLADRDDPERLVEISPLDRGSGVHAALERFLLDALQDGPPDPCESWSQEQRLHLAELAGEVFDEFEARGRTGRAVHWKLDRVALLSMLDSFLHADDRHRAGRSVRPERVELAFGLDGAGPVTIALPDGRELAFRGRADRVDRSEDGRVVVLDYKTGKGAKYKGIADGDPVQGGTTLQLGLYAEAALQHLGATSAEAHYWIVNDASGHPHHGYEWTPPRRARFLEVVTAIADGIEQGLFPAVPGEWNTFRNTHDGCAYCEFDSLCPRDRGEVAEVKLADPLLAGRAVLHRFDGVGEHE